MSDGHDDGPDGIECVTSVNFTYHTKYGVRLYRSFLEHVEPPIPLRIYCDASLEGRSLDAYADAAPNSHRLIFHDLGARPGVPAYVQDASLRLQQAKGSLYPDDPDERLNYNGYNYRYDAVTFGKKGLSFAHAMQGAMASRADEKSDRVRFVFWLDADIVIRRALSAAFLASLFEGTGVVYFGRREPHSETGFVGIDLAAPHVETFVDEYTSYWLGRRIFKLSGWTDCHAFDAARETTEEQGLVTKSLSTVPRGPVIPTSVLGDYLDHQKGKRKINATKAVAA